MSLRMVHFGLIVGTLVAAVGIGRRGFADEPPQKVALLVGVNEYRSRKFAERPLSFAERDVKDLAAELKRQGFEVHLLTGSDATKSKIDEALKVVLKGRAATDLVFLGFSGHGVQMPLLDGQGKLVKDARGADRNDAFFCPVDAVLGDGSTMISFNSLFDRLDTQGGINLVLVDACRSTPPDPDKGAARALSGDELIGRIPRNSVIFFSCAAGQEALETAKAGGGHGVFFYHVIEALRGGRAAAPDSTEVSWDDLVRFVRAEVNLRAREWLPDRAARADLRTPGKLQTPHILSNLVDNPVLARITRNSPAPRGFAESIGIKLKLIPAGTFQMGSSKEEDKDAEINELPRHEVRISHAFYLGATEVTQGQYRAITGESPSKFEGSDDLPVEQVSWFDAVRFCNALSVKEGLPAFYRIVDQTVSVSDWRGPGYRLPTEAEWEYACRGRNPARYSFGDDAADLGEYAWHLDNSGGKTHPVGQKRGNAFGLHDMHGNVWEWCWDVYDAEYYRQSPGTDPSGPLQVRFRVNRGGGWFNSPHVARSAHRNWGSPVIWGFVMGFRVARVQSGG
ncbi:SUMF1/EgtB/PvdO family nonheme iron enzyme [Singulisphaera sp. Ch08]|uniref:SUMF1/EgtB/PvdO family nonheme iron enzyme n=1 Tax=Singulisphaera sp. Ch08 TaxID=3120278 RepID=A0AAU7CAI0_9BACT